MTAKSVTGESMQRRYFYTIVPALFLGIVVTVLAIRSGSDARQSANIPVTEGSDIVLSDWNPELIISNSHNSMLVDSDAEFYQVYFYALRRFGTLQELGDASFSFDLPPLWAVWRNDSGAASYEFTAQFSNDRQVSPSN